jgi:hypothetical protein
MDMARSLAVLLFFCLSAQPVFAFNLDWSRRVRGFSQYVAQHSSAQGKRSLVLGTHSESFKRRVNGYLRALDIQARPFQARPGSGAEN